MRICPKCSGELVKVSKTTNQFGIVTECSGECIKCGKIWHFDGIDIGEQLMRIADALEQLVKKEVKI
jgi:uncharacterized protein with PIN domain